MRSLRGALAALSVASLGTACRDGGVNPCDHPFPDVDRVTDVAWPGTTSSQPASSLARLRVVQRDVPGIDGGCADAVPVRLAFVGTASQAVSFTYRVTWSGPGGGWFRDGAVTRLTAGAEVDAGTVPSAPRVGDGTLVVTVGDARTVALSR